MSFNQTKKWEALENYILRGVEVKNNKYDTIRSKIKENNLASILNCNELKFIENNSEVEYAVINAMHTGCRIYHNFIEWLLTLCDTKSYKINYVFVAAMKYDNFNIIRYIMSKFRETLDKGLVANLITPEMIKSYNLPM